VAQAREPNASDLAAACRALGRGGIVAYPTEAVFGLGCDPANRDAVERLLALKQRPVAKGLILIAADEAQLEPWVEPLTPELAARVEPTWPGPVTWLLPATATCPEYLRGAHDTIAARVTAHPGAAALCRAWGGALVSTSANRAGAEPARDAAGVRAAFGRTIDYLLNAPTGGAPRPSSIRDARTGDTLRE